MPGTPDARADLAAAVRRLTFLTTTAEASDEELTAAAAAANALADDLEARGEVSRGPRRHESSQSLTPGEFWATSPVFGPANPIAPPVVSRLVEGGLDGTATFDTQYEGPPGCVHGGVIALVLDEMLGAANVVTGNIGMTATLTIRYRKPTPLWRPLQLTGRFTHRSGRKLHAHGEIRDGDTVTAEAEGLFVEFDPMNF